jgi:hypothetical protein
VVRLGEPNGWAVEAGEAGLGNGRGRVSRGRAVLAGSGVGGVLSGSDVSARGRVVRARLSALWEWWPVRPL